MQHQRTDDDHEQDAPRNHAAQHEQRAQSSIVDTDLGDHSSSPHVNPVTCLFGPRKEPPKTMPAQREF